MDMHKNINPEEMLEVIFDCMNKLAALQDFEEAISILTELGKTLVNADRASFWYWDINRKQYWTIAASGSKRIVIAQGSGIVGASISNKEVILINDPYNDARFNSQVDKQTGYITRSILCMPVYNAAGEVMGAIQAINKLGDDGFDDKDVKRLSLAATFSGKTLEAHMLRIQNQLDALTGLKNRKGFYEYYDKVIVPYAQKDAAAIIMCDIDFFKKVNDVYGHNAGDMVLCKVAATLSHAFNESGEVFRWGGEEFIILLKTDRDTAYERAESTRKAIEKMVCQFENSDIRITMSFGVAAIDNCENADENVKKADELLYSAKNSGRNKVVI